MGYKQIFFVFKCLLTNHCVERNKYYVLLFFVFKIFFFRKKSYNDYLGRLIAIILPTKSSFLITK